MKAAIYETYGSAEVLKIQEVEKPEPKANEILIRVHGASVIAGDCELRSFNFPVLWFWLPLRLVMGVFKPKNKILGQEFAGIVEEVGAEVTRFKKGDNIFGPTDMKFGAYAAYKCIAEKAPLALKPENMSLVEAATLSTGGLNALFALRKAKIQPGEKVLINGAAGTIGSAAVQIAKYFGAEVTAVDSASKLEMLRSIGADDVIDYTREDFTKSGKTYNIIYDVVGKSSFTKCLRSLNPKGRYVLANPTFLALLSPLLPSFSGKKNLISAFAPYTSEDLNFLKELVEQGHLKATIDKTYPIENIVEAHRYVDSGQKAGNVAISI